MKTETIEEIEIVKEVPRFKGYTLDEIRYQRAMLGVRKEFCKAKVMESVSNLKPGGRRRQSGLFAAQRKPGFFSIAGKVASKFLGNLNTLDCNILTLILVCKEISNSYSLRSHCVA